MGGRIDVESRGAGQGSTFQFTIVAAIAQGDDSRNNPLAIKPFLQGRRALIVDDIETNRRILNYYVRAWGMEADDAASGAEALTMIANGIAYDVALLDYQMPGIDGLELAHKLYRLCPTLPIIMLSSVAISESLRSGIVATAALKPIRPANLLNILQKIFLEDRPSVSAPFVASVQLGETHPLRILVAEDHAINQQVIRLMLHRMGYHPDFANNGGEALDAVERQAYDVVFMDVHMPVMDGLEATQRLCARWPPSERPRIVGLSASALLEDRRAAIRCGMDDYLSKPITSEPLHHALVRCGRIRRGETTGSRFPRNALPTAESVAGEQTDGIATVAPMNALIDETSFAQIVTLASYDDNPDVLLGLVREFLTTASKLIGDARRACERGDTPAMALAMHSLKPAAAMFGALSLSNLCANMEAQSNNAGPMMAPQMTDLHQEFRKVCNAFTMRFPRLSEEFCKTILDP